MADGAIMTRLQELAGFPIVAGTLNVRRPRPLERDSAGAGPPGDCPDPKRVAAGRLLPRPGCREPVRGLAQAEGPISARPGRDLSAKCTCVARSASPTAIR